MTYQQTIEYLYEHLPMFSRIGKAAYKEDLHNTIALCEAIGNPQQKFRSIHIAGTNGKGSTSHMLAAVFQQAGYKTGLYTSPHLKDFRERIRINGVMITKHFVVEFVKKTKSISDTVEPSFFELTVAMAFDYFAQEQIDIAVIETGLGGRLDSTNIITPELSIITNIGYDHMNILGDTLEKIAFEKAGIIKLNVPVIIGEYSEETKPVFARKASDMHAPLYFAQDQFEIMSAITAGQYLECVLKETSSQDSISLKTDLPGLYQAKNLRTVHCAISHLNHQGFHLSQQVEQAAIGNVIKMTELRGRWEVIQENPMIVLDVAHNVDGMTQVIQQVAVYLEGFQIKPQLHFVIGMVKDKEVEKVLSLLPKDACYYFASAHISRALPANELMLRSAAFGLKGAVFENVNEAIYSAKESAGQNDLVLVCGSVFLVGEVEPRYFKPG